MRGGSHRPQSRKSAEVPQSSRALVCCPSRWFCKGRLIWFKQKTKQKLIYHSSGEPVWQLWPFLVQRTLLLITDETNLPADIPSYLSSQGTLADRQDGYISSENGSHHQFVTSSGGGFFLPQHDSNGTCLKRNMGYWHFEITLWKVQIQC